jgi:adenylate cyclase
MAEYVVEIRTQGAPLGTYTLKAGERHVVGRGMKADWRVEADPYMSREHAEVYVEKGQLVVSQKSMASNPITFKGQETSGCVLKPGEEVVLGNSTLQFRVMEEPSSLNEKTLVIQTMVRKPVDSHVMKSDELYSMGGDSGRLQFLSLLELPELMKTRPREEVLAHVAKVLRESTNGSWAKVLTTSSTPSPEELKVLAEDRDPARAAGTANQVSNTLIEAALRDAPRPVQYSWDKNPGATPLATAHVGIDWAIAAAAKSVGGEPPLIFYVAGEGPLQLRSQGIQSESAKFVGLLADIIARSLALERLQEKQSRLGHFFSPGICARLLQDDFQAGFQPRIAESTVMFFDVRGFSKRTEGEIENLLAYQGDLRRAMTAMTACIFEENGVVLQYMGDGLLAAWNVPVEDERHVDCACRAALRMVRGIGQATNGWGCGIGIGVGRVVAGAMGSDQVYFYGVMGSVVNQASRIEGITKMVGAPILVSDTVARRVSHTVGLTRRLGRFQLAGMTVPLDLYELLGPPGDPEEERDIVGTITLTNQGLEAFERGDWDKAAKYFRKLPDDDGPASFLLYLAMDYARHPPRAWHGMIDLSNV